MKKRIKSLMGVALALVMCLTMAPTATAKADEAVALSEYTEEQLLQAVIGDWGNEGDDGITVEKDHLYVASYFWDGVNEVKVDTDWKCEGIVEIQNGVLTEEHALELSNFGSTEGAATKALKFM